jgi:hypothetical protein
MEEQCCTRLFSRLKQHYDNKHNTFTWALVIWAITAFGFALFLPAETTVLRSLAVAGFWSAVHFVRRM